MVEVAIIPATAAGIRDLFILVVSLALKIRARDTGELVVADMASSSLVLELRILRVKLRTYKLPSSFYVRVIDWLNSN